MSEIRPAARQTEDRSRLSGRFSCPAEGDCGLAFAVPLSADVGEGSAVAGHPLEWYVGAAKGEHDGPSSAATPGQRRETGHLRLPQAVWAYGRASGHLALAREMEATWRRTWRGPESARTHSGTGPESAVTSCSTSAKLPRNGAATRNAEDHFQLKRAAACAACEDLRRDREARWRAGTGCQAERVAQVVDEAGPLPHVRTTRSRRLTAAASGTGAAKFLPDERRFRHPIVRPCRVAVSAGGHERALARRVELLG